jgi:peptidylprolyl isomerase
MRKIIAVAIALLTAASLTGCAPHSTKDMYSSLSPQCGSYTSGTAVKKISLTATAGSPVPTVKAPLGLDSKVIQTNVLVEGNGPKITGAQSIKFDFVETDAATGTVVAHSGFEGKDLQTQFLKKGTNLCSALSGVREGSTVALLVPSSIVGNTGKGAAGGIFIFKIAKVYLPHAVGDEYSNQGGLPTVIRATTGQPTIQMPKTAAPKSLKVVTLIKGWGEKISLGHGQQVMIHYVGWNWATGVKFDSSWDNNAPMDFSFEKKQLIAGMLTGLDGATVGSQLLLVIPPSLGYGSQTMGSIPPNSTLVFVVDILGVQK